MASLATITRKGFTLVELMIVVTIIGILMAATYIPYKQFSTSAQVREAAEKLSQSLVSAKSYASNGYSLLSGSGRIAADQVMIFNFTGGVVETWAVPHLASSTSTPHTASGTRIATLGLPKLLSLSQSGASSLVLYWSAPNGKLTKFRDGNEFTGAVDVFVAAEKLEVDGPLRKTVTIK